MSGLIVPKIIGITGKMEHGKTTLAGIFGARFGHVDVPFAVHLRHICNIMVGLPTRYMLDKDLKTVPIVKIGDGYALPFTPGDPVSLSRHMDMVLAQAYFVSPDIFANAGVVTSATIPLGENRLQPSTIRKAAISLFTRHILVPLHNGKVFTGREIMQLVGTEIFRAIDPSIWIWAWTQRARLHDLVVVSDMRFPNEAARIVHVNGVTCRIVRPGYVYSTERNTTHASETSLDDWSFDKEFINDQTIEHLEAAVMAWLLDYSDTSIAKQAVDNGYAKVLTPAA